MKTWVCPFCGRKHDEKGLCAICKAWLRRARK